jgi:3D (Asp-Asp-Asp) domain-containing protein
MRRRNILIQSYIALLSMILVLSLAALLSQTVFATTYVINDGDRVITCTSYATDPAEVLDQAGLPLAEYDTYTTEAVDGGSAIIVNRAQRITLHYRGQTRTVTSFGETVAQLLHRLGLELTGEDLVSHGLEEKLRDGMVLTVKQALTRQETFSSVITHDTQYRTDPELPAGTEKVLVPGQDGELLRTAEITYINGRETRRVILSEDVLRQPVAEVVAVGSGEAGKEPSALETDHPIIGDGYILLPSGELLTYTHTDTVRATAYTHTDEGCDMVTSTGSRVRWGTVAVDPRYIPYGTRMFIMASDGSYIYGLATAEDCGGDIKGDRMDLYMPTYEQCREFGRRRCTLYFLG